MAKRLFIVTRRGPAPTTNNKVPAVPPDYRQSTTHEFYVEGVDIVDALQRVNGPCVAIREAGPSVQAVMERIRISTLRGHITF